MLTPHFPRLPFLFLTALTATLTLSQPLLAQADPAGTPVRTKGRADPAVFNSLPAEMAPDIFAPHPKFDFLRILTVQERVGAARKNDLVRVPLFFHAGECPDPNKLIIVSTTDPKTPLPYQADDIRRDAAGAVSRMHVYFYVDLQPWEKKQFHLLPGTNAASTLPPMTATEADGKVTLAGDHLKLTFFTTGDKAGAIAAIQTSAGPVSIGDFLAPSINLSRQTTDPDPKKDSFPLLRENVVTYAHPSTLDIRDLRWSTGPLFSKLVLRIGPKGIPDNAEYIYLIPKRGNEFTQTQRLYPEEKNSPDRVGSRNALPGENDNVAPTPPGEQPKRVWGNILLRGKITLGDAASPDELKSIPAGLRKLTRRVYNYDNTAVVDAKSNLSLFMIPFSQTGASGVSTGKNGDHYFYGSQNYQVNPGSNSLSLRVFWGQVRYVFSKAVTEDDLWQLGVEKFQPLTAVVDEPAATPQHYSDFTTEVSQGLWNIQHWSKGPEATLAMTYMKRDDAAAKALANRVSVGNRKNLEAMIPTKEDIADAWKGWKGAGGTDPWTITYQRSGIAPASAFLYPSPGLDKQSELIADAVRLTNGRVNSYNSPNVRSFANAVNMHLGTYLLGLWGGRKHDNADLVRWTLDCLYNQALQAPYGHAQRQYSMNVGSSGGSDQLYLSVTDFWTRAIELVNNEDLTLHPSIYGRYTDCVDVNSDIYQRRILPDGTSTPTWWRAMMLRGQQHDHRWEAYGCDPFLPMLQDASNGGMVGLTEACFYTQRMVGKQPGYNIVMSDAFMPEVMLRHGLKNYRPAPRPPLPANVKVAHTDGQAVITWSAVPGKNIAGYRIYRAQREGGPWTWLNSPYAQFASQPQQPEKLAFEPPTNAQRPPLPRVKKGAVPPPLPAAEPYEFIYPKVPVTLIKQTTYTDAGSTPNSLYFVTAEDTEFRESRWFPAEPAPQPSPAEKPTPASGK